MAGMADVNDVSGVTTEKGKTIDIQPQQVDLWAHPMVVGMMVAVGVSVVVNVILLVVLLT